MSALAGVAAGVTAMGIYMYCTSTEDKPNNNDGEQNNRNSATSSAECDK